MICFPQRVNFDEALLKVKPGELISDCCLIASFVACVDTIVFSEQLDLIRMLLIIKDFRQTSLITGLKGRS